MGYVAGTGQTKTGVGLGYRLVASRLSTKKCMMLQLLLGVVCGISLLAACAPKQNPPSLSVSSASSSSDIVIRRSVAVSNAQSTIVGSSAVNVNNGTPVNSGINVDNAPQQNPAADLSNDSQNEVATSVIDSIIWQIQTGPAPHLLILLYQRGKTRH